MASPSPLAVACQSALALTALVTAACGNVASSDDDAGAPTDAASDTAPPKHSSGTGSGTGHHGSGSSEAPPPGAHVGQPPDAAGHPSTLTTHHNFAIYDIFLGDSVAPTFTPSATAWASFGYNVDGLVTTARSKDVCKLQDGAPTSTQVDGIDGIDNSFGANIDAPVLSSFVSSQQLSQGNIQQGSFTLELDTVGLDSEHPTTQTATGLSGSVFVGGFYNSVPPLNAAMTGYAITDDWPVVGTLLKDGTLDGGSLLTFDDAYITHGTWVNGTPSTIPLALSISGRAFTVTIRHARVTFGYRVDPTGQGHAVDGIMSGVVDTRELVGALNALGGELGETFCGLIASFLPNIYRAQDILADGTNHADAPCNAISIGIGIRSDEIAIPSQVAPPHDAGAAAPPCGTDGGG